MSNLLPRIAVAGLGIPLLLYLGMAGSWPLKLLVMVLQGVMLYEWRFLAVTRGMRPFVPGMLVGAAALDVLVLAPENPQIVALACAGLGAMLAMETFRSSRTPLHGLGAASLYLAYVVLPLSLWTLFAARVGAPRFEPLGALPCLLITTWVCDSSAYVAGRLWGRHLLYRAASPAKTVEGFVGGVVLSACVLPVLHLFGAAEPATLDYLALPVIVGGIGQLGDLLESLMKRESSVKDTSSLLPGHGGFLDRFDSLLLSTPFFFAYLSLTVA